MNKTTCLTDECAQPVAARGLCKKCYGKAWRAGDLPAREGPARPRHSLTDVNVEARTATCSVCGPTDIRVRDTTKRGHECMTLRREQGARRRRRLGERIRPDYQTNKGMYRKWKYGLTEDDMDALIKQAGGRCLICDVEFGDKFHIDHCHETGLVRGLLCARCNYGLGWFDDNPARLIAAHLYLQSGGKAVS